jgi:hypothetical protein
VALRSGFGLRLRPALHCVRRRLERFHGTSVRAAERSAPKTPSPPAAC